MARGARAACLPVRPFQGGARSDGAIAGEEKWRVLATGFSPSGFCFAHRGGGNKSPCPPPPPSSHSQATKFRVRCFPPVPDSCSPVPEPPKGRFRDSLSPLLFCNPSPVPSPPNPPQRQWRAPPSSTVSCPGCPRPGRADGCLGAARSPLPSFLPFFFATPSRRAVRPLRRPLRRVAALEPARAGIRVDASRGTRPDRVAPIRA